MALIEDRLRQVKDRINAACLANGRDPAEVRLLAMSKTRSVSEIREAHAAGIQRFGENRPQELAAKATELSGSGVEFALAGHLQTNKAKLVAAHAVEFQALDSLHLAQALDRRCQSAGRGLDVLVQVNSSGEPQKHGIEPSQALGFAKELAHCSALRVRGLMTIAIQSTDSGAVGACFDRVRDVQRQLRDSDLPGEWDELSMGMTADFELAIAKGSTCVRIGTAIFGPRKY